MKLHSNDWFRILADLRDAGVNNAEVARKLSVAPATVFKWKSGTEPSHYYGELLLMLRKEHCEMTNS